MAAEDKNYRIIEQELRLISRHANNVLTDDHDSVHEISMAVNSALRALAELRLASRPGVTGEALTDSYERRAA